MRNRYANKRLDDIRGKNPYFKADGDEVEYENEESVEPDAEDYTYEADMSEAQVPKYRQLVRAKKLELKAQFGKAHFTTRKECKNVPTPTTCYKKVAGVNVPYPCMKNKEVCITIPTWVWGWRKKWREFKNAGGLAQLKMVAKGMAPYVPPGTVDPNAVVIPPTNVGTGGGTRGGRTATAVDLLENTPATIEMQDETIIDTTKASLAGPIIFTLLSLGIIGAMIKYAK
ncbi:MAG TPA: hypothetical protein PK289_00030 [Bacteroidia bacterium]|nr:hypothetical protein [Bacteroidia bacterium]